MRSSSSCGWPSAGCVQRACWWWRPSTPSCMLTYAGFYGDFTHVAPVPPLALEWLAQSCGFASLRSSTRHRSRPRYKLRLLPASTRQRSGGRGVQPWACCGQRVDVRLSGVRADGSQARLKPHVGPRRQRVPAIVGAGPGRPRSRRSRSRCAITGTRWSRSGSRSIAIRSALWAQLFAFRMTNVSDVGELLVATDAPCHLLRHRRKVLWLTEHYPWLDDESPRLPRSAWPTARHAARRARHLPSPSVCANESLARAAAPSSCCRRRRRAPGSESSRR